MLGYLSHGRAIRVLELGLLKGNYQILQLKKSKREKLLKLLLRVIG